MSIIQIPYTGQAYKIGAIVAGGVLLSGAENSAVNTGTSRTQVFADGALGPRTSFISAMDPSIPFTTRNLGILSMTGTRGTAIEDIGTGENQGTLDIYMELLQPNASIYGGAKHFKWRANKGFLSPNSLQGESDNVFMVDYTLHVAAPAQEWPLIPVSEQELPALEEIQLFGMGPMFVNGLYINTKQNANFEFNPTVNPFRRDGNIYPECFYLENFAPKLSISMADQSFALPAKLGRNGHADRIVSGTQGTCMYLRKRRPGSEYYPNTDAVHTKLTFAGDYHFDQLAGGSSQEISESTFLMDIVQSGSASSQEIDIQTGVIIPTEINTSNP